MSDEFEDISEEGEYAEAYFMSGDPALGEARFHEIAMWRWRLEWPQPDLVIYGGREYDSYQDFLSAWLKDHAKPFQLRR